MNHKSCVYQISECKPDCMWSGCIVVDRQCRGSKGTAKIEGYMSISDEEAHHRTLHCQPTDANLGEESLNLNSVIDIMSPTEHCSSSTDSCSADSPSINLFSPSSSSHSTQKHRIIIEDVTDDEDDNDASTSRRSPGSHYLYSHFSVRENSNSTPRHETLSSGPKII